MRASHRVILAEDQDGGEGVDAMLDAKRLAHGRRAVHLPRRRKEHKKHCSRPSGQDLESLGYVSSKTPFQRRVHFDKTILFVENGKAVSPADSCAVL
jgi:hypothetical protein